MGNQRRYEYAPLSERTIPKLEIDGKKYRVESLCHNVIPI